MLNLTFLADPESSFWLWANLAMGALGLWLTFFAWKQAKSAQTAAEEAKTAMVRLAQEYQLNDLRTDLIGFQQLVSGTFGGSPVVSGGHVSSQARGLRGRARELRQRVVEGEHGDSIRAKLDLTAQFLESIAIAAVNQRTGNPTKLERITASLGDAISAVSDAIGFQRNEQRGTSR